MLMKPIVGDDEEVIGAHQEDTRRIYFAAQASSCRFHEIFKVFSFILN
jgi:hypothetical protein